MKQLCLFCRGEGVYCLEKEGDLATYVDCAYCDSLEDHMEDDLEFPRDKDEFDE